MKSWLGPLALYVVAAIAGTWPLVLQISTHLPLGSLGSATVPLFNVWTLEWNAAALVRGYQGYWDAPIFHPTPGTFALSEAQAFTGLEFAGLARWFGSVIAYNLVLLSTLVFNGLAARRLLHVLGASEFAAAATGLLAVGFAFAWKELGVLQLTVLWPIWLAISELAILAGARGVLEKPVRAGETNASAAALVRLALCYAVLVWTCTYYALFLAVFLVPAVALFVRREFFRPPVRGAVLFSLLLLLAAGAPLLAQQRVVAGFSRSPKTVHDGGATGRAYSRLPRGAVGGHVVPLLAAKPEKRSLYPGTLLLVFAAIGVWSLRPQRVHARVEGPTALGAPRAGPSSSFWFGARERAHSFWTNTREHARQFWVRPAPGSRFFAWCAVSLVLALVLSFGSRWSIGSVHPYEWIVERHWPGFANVRSPYRFAAFTQVLALVFAGIGLDAVGRARWIRLPTARRALLMAAASLAFLEVMPLGARLSRFPAEALAEPWIEYLAQHPGGAVAMIPPALSGKAEAFEPTTVAMLQAFRHGHPLLNGYSGFFPPISDAYIDALKQFPNVRSKRLLARVPVRYAVVDKTWLGPRSDDALAPLTRVFDSPTRAIYFVPSNVR
jgi:hypothetical protein